jgi:hypothetical protein
LQDSKQNALLEQISKHTTEEQQKLAAQVIHLDKVTPGGFKGYIENAIKLLEDSKNEVNPFANYNPEVPIGVSLYPGTPEFDEIEELGV